MEKWNKNNLGPLMNKTDYPWLYYLIFRDHEGKGDILAAELIKFVNMLEKNEHGNPL